MNMENRSDSGQGKESPKLPASARKGSPGFLVSIGQWRMSRSISKKRGTIFIPVTAWRGHLEEKHFIIRDMQKFNLEARKYRGVSPPITATSMGQAVQPKPEKPFVGFGRMMEAEIQ